VSLNFLYIDRAKERTRAHTIFLGVVAALEGDGLRRDWVVLRVVEAAIWRRFLGGVAQFDQRMRIVWRQGCEGVTVFQRSTLNVERPTSNGTAREGAGSEQEQE
jgi:hypothetical protein